MTEPGTAGGPAGWAWLGEVPAPREDRLEHAFAACFRGSDGELVLAHLRRLFLDRRLGPAASDAELRHVEGQRSVVAHIAAMIDRGRGWKE